MKKFLYLLAASLLALACENFETSNPYRRNLVSLNVALDFPEGYERFERPGIMVTVEDVTLAASYTLPSSLSGSAKFTLPPGLYRVSAQDLNGDDIFNGAIDRILLREDSSVSLSLTHSIAGKIIIKEIYCGGCMKLPQQGTYALDQYVILHNNHTEVQYLDSLCFGCLAPYNSNTNNPYGITLPDYLPVIQAVWQFPGDGKSFPLNPGEDAVLCLKGAIDHSREYPLSVNLNKEDYFVCYNPTLFTNISNHPVPGNLIRENRWMNLVIKTGKANAYTYSINSPATIVFKTPSGLSIEDYLAAEGSVEQLPGSTVDKVTKVLPEWVMDAVEVFNGKESTNNKRLLSTLDAGYVTLSGTYLGHTLMRKVDEKQSALRGYEVLLDTNNSTNDFYERETQSLHDE